MNRSGSITPRSFQQDAGVSMAGQMGGLTIDELIFKGTHNSYSCTRARPLCVNHPPDTQIDDFGVWSLEIDYSFDIHHGGPVPVVGHDRPRQGACWAHSLEDYLRLVVSARALAFRPVFVCFDVKRWKRPWPQFWRPPVDRAFGFEEKWNAGLDALRTVCAGSFELLEDWLRERDRWPLPAELAGKVVLYEPNKRLPDGRPSGLRGTHAAHCVTPAQVEAAIETGQPLERNGSVCAGGARALRLDQYQADWTFDYGVPPNPLVVDPEAPAHSTVDDAVGKRWRCPGETSHGQTVGQHGTYRFPYRTVEQAVERARGITPATGGVPDARRAGLGWTVLVRGGSLVEAEFDSGVPLQLRIERSTPGHTASA
jgi:hypothetical protein